MSIQASIENKLTAGLDLAHLEVENESHMHNVPAGSESHFKVVVVAETFEGKSLVARHQLIYKLLSDEMRGKIHALALHTYTPQEWRERNNEAPLSPPCKGGSKA